MTALPLECLDAAPAARTPLRLVPPPDVARPSRRAGARVAPLRLTRRFRLLRTFAIVFLLAASGFAVQAWLTGPGPLEADHATVVRPGQTLSDVATEQMPGTSVSRAVQLITQLNALPSAEVPAGRTILVPAA